MIVCVAIVSTVKKKTSSFVPPYESSVNVFDDNIIRRLAVLISEFHGFFYVFSCLPLISEQFT